MAKLIYSAITSLDGYVADADDNFDWAMPDDAVHQFVNDLERSAGTYLYGRRMYEVMKVWETMASEAELLRRRARLRRDLAGGRQDRLLHLIGCGVDRPDPTRATVRSRGGPRAESECRTRHQRGRAPSRGSGDQGRPGRRVPPVPQSRRGGRRQPGAPRRRLLSNSNSSTSTASATASCISTIESPRDRSR